MNRTWATTRNATRAATTLDARSDGKAGGDKPRPYGCPHPRLFPGGCVGYPSGAGRHRGVPRGRSLRGARAKHPRWRVPWARHPAYALGFVATVAAALLCVGCGPGNEAAEHPGKAVYQRYCYACHQAGIADAPKLGDKDAWAVRLTKTRAELVDNVIRGMPPGMPPRAGCGTCTNEELTEAVDFMVRRVE